MAMVQKGGGCLEARASYPLLRPTQPRANRPRLPKQRCQVITSADLPGMEVLLYLLLIQHLEALD